MQGESLVGGSALLDVGDQLVHVNVWTPKKLNDEEIRLLEKLRGMPNFHPNPGREDKGFIDKIKDMFG